MSANNVSGVERSLSPGVARDSFENFVLLSLGFLMSVLVYKLVIGLLARPALENYPGCGQVGDRSRVECIWDCSWTDNPLYRQQIDFTLLNTLL